LTNSFDVPALDAMAEGVLLRLRPVLAAKEARAVEEGVAAVKDRIARRRLDLERQLMEPEPKSLQFEQGVARLTGWQPTDPPDGGSMERTSAPDGKAILRIRAGPMTSASWRAQVRLGKGRYRFEGLVRTKAVEPLNFGKNQGASLRVLSLPEASAHLMGDQNWNLLRLEFEVIPLEQQIDLLCDLRAGKGEAWFDLDSLRLLRLP
jgi:hypothetical protein